MNNKLKDLNNHLFAQLERLNDEELSKEDLDKEIARGKAIAVIANNVINNNRAVLDAMKLLERQGVNIEDFSKKLLE